MPQNTSIADELKPINEGFIKELNQSASNKIEYWDIRCSLSTGMFVDFTDRKSKEISSYETLDCGIRTFYNGGWGFVVLKDLSKNSIRNGFSQAIKLAQFSESLCKEKFKIKQPPSLKKEFQIRCNKKLSDIDITEKLSYVKDQSRVAYDYSPQVKNVRLTYSDGQSNLLFLNSAGSRIYQDLSLLRIYCVTYAQKEGIIQRGINTVGGLGGFEIAQTETAKNLGLNSAQEAVALLDAKSPMGGRFAVIMDPKLTGTFVHEAFGHAVEADLVLNKESILEGRIGEKVALDDVSIVENPTMGQGKKYNLPYELFGCYFVDDEGVPAQKVSIIENGVLKNYLHNLETASRMNCAPNGHGRAQGSSARAQVRMGVTLLEPKDWDLEEMIKDTKNGVLCEDFLYGYTDSTTGNFQFKCKLSYKIEKGEKKELMRDVALSGMTLEILNRISAIGKKASYSDGMCGKGGQSVRTSDGGPYIRVEDVTIGGLS